MPVPVSRAEPGLADFYAKPQPWVKDALCLNLDTRMFFEHIDNARGVVQRKHSIEKMQFVCAQCPVRIQCAEEAMLQEGDSDELVRFGFRGYMTPQQRASLARRGGLRGRDPIDVVEGRDGDRRVPPIPLHGDKWSRHHTTLARKIIPYLNSNCEVGALIPTRAQLCEALGCKLTPLNRVLKALVQDGVLDLAPGNQHHAGYRLRRVSRVVSWLPPHLTGR